MASNDSTRVYQVVEIPDLHVAQILVRLEFCGAAQYTDIVNRVYGHQAFGIHQSRRRVHKCDVFQRREHVDLYFSRNKQTLE